MHCSLQKILTSSRNIHESQELGIAKLKHTCIEKHSDKCRLNHIIRQLYISILQLFSTVNKVIQTSSKTSSKTIHRLICKRIALNNPINLGPKRQNLERML